MIPPTRVVSLVPSLTELLFDLGLGERVVGVTRYCVHPAEEVKKKTVVGGTKRIFFDRIEALQPDWILANDEENRKEDVLRLKEHYPVLVTHIANWQDVYQLILELGEVFQSPQRAENLWQQIQECLLRLPKVPQYTVAYLIWKKPFMSVGGDTFIHTMLTTCGFVNLFGSQRRYPQTSLEEIREKRPDFVFLPSEPYPFSEEEREEMAQQLPDTTVVRVDGEMFTWYGSRILHTYRDLIELLNTLLERKE